MALFFLVGHAGAAGLSATPNPIQWAVDQDPDSQQIEIENTGGEPLVGLRYFGPAVHRNMPEIGEHRRRS